MKTKIIHVSLLVLCLCSTLLFADLITKPAFALISKDVSLTNVSRITVSEQTKYTTWDSTSRVIHTARQTETTTTTTTNTLPTLSSGKSYLTAFGCNFSTTLCAVAETNGASTINRFLVVTNLGTISVNASMGGKIPTNDFIKIIGTSLYIPSVCSTVDSDRVVTVWSTTDGSSIGQIGDCSGTNWGANNLIDLESNGSTLIAISATVTAQTRAFEVWSTATGARVCQGSSLSLTSPEGDITYFNNNFYLVDGTSILVFSASACVAGTTIATGVSGAGTITHVDVNTARDELYIVDATSVHVMNTTSSGIQSLSYTVPCTSTSARDQFAKPLNSLNQFACFASNTLHVKLLDSSGVPSGEDEEFCSQPENVNLLRCRLLAQQGGQLGSFADLVGGTFGNSTNNLFVQLGLVDAGSDIKTNGVGYAFIVVGLGLMTAILFLASGGDLHRIPTFVWFIGTLAIVGGLAGFGFILPEFFIIAILAVIALATAKILSTLEVGGFR